MYATTTAAAGLASRLTLPILSDGEVVGSVILYAATPGPSTATTTSSPRRSAASAAGAVRDVTPFFYTRPEAAAGPTILSGQHDSTYVRGHAACPHRGLAATVERRPGALEARTVIGEAIGMLSHRTARAIR